MNSWHLSWLDNKKYSLHYLVSAVTQRTLYSTSQARTLAMDTALVAFFTVSVAVYNNERTFLEFLRRKIDTASDDTILIAKNGYFLTARETSVV